METSTIQPQTSLELDLGKFQLPPALPSGHFEFAQQGAYLSAEADTQDGLKIIRKIGIIIKIDFGAPIPGTHFADPMPNGFNLLQFTEVATSKKLIA